MRIIFDYAQGKITHAEFEAATYNYPEVWDKLQAMVPDDIQDADCAFRQLYGNMRGFETNNYRVKATVTSFGYIPALAHSMICALVRYHHPEIICRTPPEHSVAELLEAMGLDYLGGDQADDFLRDFFVAHTTSNKRQLKKELKELFHLEGNKYPYWMQDPEWPMYNGKPMKFISQTNTGDLYVYVFKDIDTGSIQTIEQFG